MTDYVLETPRLVLREMRLGDLDFVAAMLGSPEVMRFYPKVYTREESRGWIDRQRERYARDGHGLWLALGRGNCEPIGQVGLLRQCVDRADEPEIGYLIYQPFWRRGYATEAARAVRDLAFGPRNLSRVISLIRPDNLPSQGVARKLGMSPEKRTSFRGREHLVFAVSRGESESGHPQLYQG